MADVIPMPDEACEVRMVHPDRVETTRKELITSDEAGELADRFRLWADPGRLRMIYALLEAGELYVCDLAATVHRTILVKLWRKGLLERHKDGRAYAYHAVHTREQWTARRMGELLAVAENRSAALSYFVSDMRKSDVDQLRRLLRVEE